MSNSSATGNARGGSTGSSAASASSGGSNNADSASSGDTTGADTTGTSVTADNPGPGLPSAAPAIHIDRDVFVRWHTDLPTDSEVYYSLIPPEEETADSERAIDMSTTTSHTVDLKDLLSGTTYHLLVVSKTPAGEPVYVARSKVTLP